MNRPVASIRLAHNSSSQAKAYPRFHGVLLVLARLLWIALAVLILILYLFGFPAAFRYYRSICIGAGCDGPQLTAGQFLELRSHGISLDFFAVYNLAFEFIFVAVWFLVAVANPLPQISWNGWHGLSLLCS